MSDTDDYLAVNQRFWDEAALVHPQTAYFREHIERLKAGGTTLRQLEIDEVGDVAGKRLLHMQCHIGTESASWAKRGAAVTGLDFSTNAIAQARLLAGEVGVDIRFVQSSVYDAPSALDEQFDVVYTSWGVLGWLPDLFAWARVVAGFIKPGGILYLAEFHPTAWIFDDTIDELRVRYPYFPEREPVMDESVGTYADHEATLVNARTYSWPFTLGDVVTSLIDAGLRIEFLHEYPRSPENLFKVLVEDEGSDPASGERWYRPRDGLPSLPLAFSLRARKPADAGVGA